MDAPTRGQKIIIGITTVGLHVLLITLLFFIIQIDEKKVIQITLEPEQKALLAKAYDLPAALKPKKSNFSVPVVFKDVPTAAPSVKTITDRPPTQITQKNEPKKEKPKFEKKMQTEIGKKPEISDLKTILASIEKIRKVESTDKQKKSAEKQPSDSAKATTDRPLDKQKIKQQVPKKTLSLADLTRGFLDQIKDEGDNAIKMDGDPNKMPTDEQLKHERYQQKIQWCLQNTFKIYRERAPRVAENTEIKVYLEIEQDGHIHELQIAQSSGNASFDQFMMFAFKEASPSFPPLPRFIKKTPLQIVYTVIVYNHGWAPGGFSAY